MPASTTVRGPGHDRIPIRWTLELQACRRHAAGTVRSTVDAAEPGQIEMAPAGNVRTRVDLTEAPDVVRFRLQCRAQMAEDWLLAEAALRFALPAAGWGLLLPSGWGRQLDEIPSDLDWEGNYPGWSALAQLVILQGPAGGLSVSVSDARLELKLLRVRREGDDVVIEVVRVPELRDGVWTVDGACDVIIAPYEGGWENAAADYRRRQEQVRPELTTPRPLHPLMAADPVWLVQNCFVFPPHSAAETIAAAKSLNAPALVHLYNWQDAPFDTRYPEWIGFREEAVPQIRALAAAGIGCVPYTNARQWDTTLPSYEPVGEALVCRDAAMGPITETYATSNIPLGVVCPSQSVFHEKLVEVCRQLAKAPFEFPGLYLDQLGAAFGLRCYGTDHGHAPGGAKSWNAGQREMLGAICTMLADGFERPIFLTTENASEPLVDRLDGFLYYCGKRDETLGRPVPLWQTIYGDHGSTFGDYFDDCFDAADTQPSSAFLGRIARQAIFGNQLGWLSPHCLSGGFACVAELIRSARAARMPLRDAIRHGRLCTDVLDTTAERSGVFLSA